MKENESRQKALESPGHNFSDSTKKIHVSIMFISCCWHQNYELIRLQATETAANKFLNELLTCASTVEAGCQPAALWEILRFLLSNCPDLNLSFSLLQLFVTLNQWSTTSYKQHFDSKTIFVPLWGLFGAAHEDRASRAQVAQELEEERSRSWGRARARVIIGEDGPSARSRRFIGVL